jgi:hypothetical protein
MLSLRILFFILVLINISCYTPYSYRKQLKNLDYNGQTNINENIFTHGYYYSIDSSSNNMTPYTLILFNDGTFLQNIIFNNDIHHIESKLCVIENNTNKEKYSYRSWGFYQIKHDTIRGYVIHPYGGMSLYLYDIEFKIINDSTIERIMYNYNPATVSSIDLEKSKELFNNDNRRILRFNKTECVPVFNPWLKQKRWFWADKKAYKAYMKEYRREQKM